MVVSVIEALRKSKAAKAKKTPDTDTPQPITVTEEEIINKVKSKYWLENLDDKVSEVLETLS